MKFYGTDPEESQRGPSRSNQKGYDPRTHHETSRTDISCRFGFAGSCYFVESNSTEIALRLKRVSR